MASSSLPAYLNLRNIMTFVLVLPILAVIFVALAIAAMSVIENTRYARATTQIMELATASKDYATRELNFAIDVNQDALTPLVRALLIRDTLLTTEPPSITNPWGRQTRLSSSGSSIVRLETDIPVHDCRRIASFFGKDPSGTGLLAMEARQMDMGIWRRFYDTSQSRFDPKKADAACGRERDTTLALFFKVRG